MWCRFIDGEIAARFEKLSPTAQGVVKTVLGRGNRSPLRILDTYDISVRRELELLNMDRAHVRTSTQCSTNDGAMVDLKYLLGGEDVGFMPLVNDGLIQPTEIKNRLFYKASIPRQMTRQTDPIIDFKLQQAETREMVVNMLAAARVPTPDGHAVNLFSTAEIDPLVEYARFVADWDKNEIYVIAMLSEGSEDFYESTIGLRNSLRAGALVLYEFQDLGLYSYIDGRIEWKKTTTQRGGSTVRVRPGRLSALSDFQAVNLLSVSVFMGAQAA